MAEAISNMVHNMPIRPPELNNSFKVSLGVSIAVSLKIAWESAPIVESETVAKISG